MADTSDHIVRCSCGRPIRVRTTQAGSEVTCDCGCLIQVPKLSALRCMMGKGSYETGVIDTIHRLIKNGELPWGEKCALSGQPTSDYLTFEVECERRWIKGPSIARYVCCSLIVLFFPILLLWILLDKSVFFEQKQELGRDKIIRIPLRVAQMHQSRALRMKTQRGLRRLLRTVPVYSQLLDEYRGARIRPLKT
jgi:hypothetical protein